MLPSLRWTASWSLKDRRMTKLAPRISKSKSPASGRSRVHPSLNASNKLYTAKSHQQRTYATMETAPTNPTVINMVKEQATILAKKSRSLRPSVELNARVDREANAVVAANVRKLVKNGQVKQVEQLLRSSSVLSLVPFVAALRSMMRAGETEEMHALFRLMRSRSILPQASVFGEVVAHFAKEAASTKKKASAKENEKRAHFFFNDLKTAFVPPAFCYAAMWHIVPTNPKHPQILTPAHDALWKEMISAGVQPLENLFLAVLRSIRARHTLESASRSQLETPLAEFQTQCHASFGFNMQTRTDKALRISRKIVKSWLGTVLLVQGEAKAFELASSFTATPEGDIPSRQATVFLESRATLLADSPAFSPSSLHHSVQIIPTDFSAFEPLIEMLSKKNPRHPLIISAWNAMPASSQLGASPSTFTAVATAVANAVDITNLYHAAPAITKQDASFQAAFQALSKQAGIAKL